MSVAEIMKRSLAKRAVKSVAKKHRAVATASADPLLVLDDLVPCRLLCRPSKTNRSPYVADAILDGGREVLIHVPSLDMGGKCVPGARLLVAPARTRKGELVGHNSPGKYGKPKCEFIARLLRVEEPENTHLGGCWIGAHPSLGERLARALLERNVVSGLPAEHTSLRSEVSGVAGCNMRSDFVLGHKDGSQTVIEVKTVVDTDYDPVHAPERSGCVFLGQGTPYERASIFPWGKKNQVGPDGEKVVSARAIKHVDELAGIARGERREPGIETLRAVVLFIVVREDATTFRPNHEACASFARHLVRAHGDGVKVLAHRVRWGEGDDVGKAFHDGELAVDLSRAG